MRCSSCGSIVENGWQYDHERWHSAIEFFDGAASVLVSQVSSLEATVRTLKERLQAIETLHVKYALEELQDLVETECRESITAHGAS